MKKQVYKDTYKKMQNGVEKWYTGFYLSVKPLEQEQHRHCKQDRNYNTIFVDLLAGNDDLCPLFTFCN